MKHILLTTGLLCSVAVPVSAHADILENFTLNATLDSGTVSGTVTLDATSGAFIDSNLTAIYDGTTYLFTGAPILFDQEPAYERTHFGDSAIANIDFAVNLPVSTLVGYSGGALCSANAPCTGTGSNVESGFGSGTSTLTDAVTTGTLTVTPEPSSLLLLGTGALGLAAAARRRFLRC